MREVLSQIWERATATQPAPEPAVVVAVALVALALVLLPRAWSLTRHLVTISHEGGHALVAVLTGRRLRGIRLHADTSGVTLSRGRPTGPGMVAMLAAGYLAPAVAGLASALLLAAGHSLALLWLAVGWLSLMLLQIRNAYGLLVLLVCAAGAGLASWYLAGTTVSLLAYLLTWVLLLAAPKPVLELMRQRRRGQARGSDVDQLTRLTRVPALLWELLFLLANVAGLAVGVFVLLPSVVAGFSWSA
ncbi:M50 family metallopeptidase [Microlunatus aurantiacus]|uniref:M50 family metallopeptidase n=1 Tax=Microlunatus aurantiacus TaxID=446786 RepID=A0ABP7D380_9ACTN